MKKIFISLLFLAACNGKHFAWVSDKEEVDSKPIEVLKTDIGGVEFTFDDGPNLAFTPKILDTLKKYKLQATFFVEGINLVGDSEQAKERRELLRRMDREGHKIGNHTYDHKDLCRISMEQAKWQLETTDKLIWQAVSSENGQHIGKWFPSLVMRPPYGKKCKQLTRLLKDRNLEAVYWDIDPREWERNPKTHQQKTVTEVLDTIMEQYHKLRDDQGQKKMIIILHDTKKLTAELLPELLAKLTKENN